MKRSDYESLSRLQSLDEAGHALQSNPSYARVLEPGLTHIHRDTIERKLLLSLYADYNRLYEFVSSVRLRKFLDAYILKHEIQAIKLMLCMAYDERDISQDLEGAEMLFPKRRHVDVDQLRKAYSVPELIEGLSGTEFHTLLSRVYNKDSSLFDLESQLDLYYYKHLNECIDEYLDKPDAKIMRKIVGMETDLHNISWIYRLKTYYRVDRDLIYAHLMPPMFRLGKNHLKELIATNSLEEFKNVIHNGPYAREFGSGTNLDPDAVCERELGRLYTTMRRRHTRSTVPIIAYMYFKEKEIRNLTSLFEGIRYRLAPQEIMRIIGGELS